MKVAEIVRAEGSQLVRLPEEFHLDGDTGSIRRQGEAIVQEPVKTATWPPRFFDRIRIDDPASARPPQGRFRLPPNWIDGRHALPTRHEYVHGGDAPSHAGAATPGRGGAGRLRNFQHHDLRAVHRHRKMRRPHEGVGQGQPVARAIRAPNGCTGYGRGAVAIDGRRPARSLVGAGSCRRSVGPGRRSVGPGRRSVGPGRRQEPPPTVDALARWWRAVPTTDVLHPSVRRSNGGVAYIVERKSAFLGWHAHVVWACHPLNAVRRATDSRSNPPSSTKPIARVLRRAR